MLSVIRLPRMVSQVSSKGRGKGLYKHDAKNEAFEREQGRWWDLLSFRCGEIQNQKKKEVLIEEGITQTVT